MLKTIKTLNTPFRDIPVNTYFEYAGNKYYKCADNTVIRVIDDTRLNLFNPNAICNWDSYCHESEHKWIQLELSPVMVRFLNSVEYQTSDRRRLPNKWFIPSGGLCLNLERFCIQHGYDYETYVKELQDMFAINSLKILFPFKEYGEFHYHNTINKYHPKSERVSFVKFYSGKAGK